jgi:hypothetical protein
MKSFKEYLTESKKTYEFKVKIAGDCPTDCAQQVKAALAQFHVETCSSGKSVPIQERHAEFPEHKNIAMTIFDVATTYPATNEQIRSKVAEALSLAHSMVKVKNMAEEYEYAINHEHDNKTGKAILGTPYEASNNQDLVGEKYVMNFLKELSQEKKTGTEYTGVNDQLLAKSTASHKQTKMETTNKKTGTVSTIGSKQVKLPDPMKGVR